LAGDNEGLVFQEEEGVNLISCTQRSVNFLSQPLGLEIFLNIY